MTPSTKDRPRYEWEMVATCDFCGGAGRRLYMESSVPHWYQKKPMRLEECTGCGLVFASPRPNLGLLHRDYLAGGPVSQQAVAQKLARPRVRRMHRKAIRTALRFLNRPPERLYDMGCGAGTTLMEAKALGLEAWGNDINKSAVDMLNASGCRAFHGFSKEIELPEAYFDVVLNFDYLEHSYTPLADLQKCFAITKPGGVLSLKTLYLDSPPHRAKGEGWELFCAGHFHFFTPDVLQSMLESVGYEILDVELGELIHIVAKRPADQTEPRRTCRPKPRQPGVVRRLAQGAANRLIALGLYSR
jgi:SAM-dependent methyltransferase